MSAQSGRQSAARHPFFVLRSSSLILSPVLGALTVLGFAPFYLFPVPVLTLAWLFMAWRRAHTPGQAALVGFAFGLGLFLAGVSWVYVSMRDFGAMPAPLAALATLLFCAYLALFPAFAAYISRRMRAMAALPWMLLAAAAWTLAEWVRGWLFTGFPWLAIGYSQAPWSPLAGYAPLLGVYGVSLTAAVSAGLLAAAFESGSPSPPPLFHQGRGVRGGAAHCPWKSPQALLFFILAVVWLAGFALKQVAWTAAAGAPVTVSLLQGNIPQELKWRPERVRPTLETYRDLVKASNSRLIILPETALPLFRDQAPPAYLEELAARARSLQGDILIGLPEYDPAGGSSYYNSVFSLGTAPAQVYRKSHLVPFGEFIPVKPIFGWIINVLKIPLSDFSPGAKVQTPLSVAGQRVAVNICYEDVFGEEIIRQLPQATVLVNVSNDAWFGRSLGPQQHFQIAQMRALETGRYMLRATNTGVSGVIGPQGRAVARVPQFVTTVLHTSIQGLEGRTPYVLWGNGAVLALCGLATGFALIAARYRARVFPGSDIS